MSAPPGGEVERRQMSRTYREYAEAGTLPPPEFVIVGVPVALDKKRVYASLKIPKAKFGIEEVNHQSTWHLSTAMPNMIVITRDTYSDALDELMRVWANQWGGGLPKLGMGPGHDPAERRAARRAMLEAADHPGGYLHPDARRELAQMRALESGEAIRIGIADVGLRIDAGSRRAWHNGAELGLTRREYELLVYLAERKGSVCTREQLMDEVWGNEWAASKTLDMHVSWLRRKLGDPALKPQIIKTVRGVGFRYDGPVQSGRPAVITQHELLKVLTREAICQAIDEGARVSQVDGGWLVEMAGVEGEVVDAELVDP